MILLRTGKEKCRGLLDMFTVFVYRGLGRSRNFAGRVLLLIARTARRTDVIPLFDILACNTIAILVFTTAVGQGSRPSNFVFPRVLIGRLLLLILQGGIAIRSWYAL